MPNLSIVQQYLRARRMDEHLRPRRRRRAPKLGTPRYPWALERAYAAALRKLFERMRTAARESIVKALPVISKQAQNEGLPLRHTDDWAGLAVSAVALLQAEVDDIFSDDDLEELTGRFGRDVSSWQKRDVARCLAAIGGVEVGTELWLAPQLSSFVTNNVSEIKGLAGKARDEVERIVLQGVRQGVRWEEMSDKILGVGGRFDVAESRANLIARDQIAQFNGDLNRVRQMHAGIESYRWRTMGDDRVRDTHAAQEGKVFLWSSGGAEGIGHPGDDYQCRCIAEPIFPEDEGAGDDE